MWALLVLLVCLPGAFGASRFHERNNTGLLWAFDMTAGQLSDSPPAFVPDFTGRGLLGNLTTATNGAIQWNPTRQGFRIPTTAGGPRAVSQLTSAAVTPLIPTEFAIELFFSSPINPASFPRHIASFGAETSPDSCEYGGATSTGGWRIISNFWGEIRFTVAMMQNGAPYCVEATFEVDVDQLQHVVFQVGPGSLGDTYYDTMVYIKSHSMQTWRFPPNLSLNSSRWDARRLILGDPDQPPPWGGSLYWIGMYDRVLSIAEIDANQAFGPPNSFPYGVGGVTATEDAPLVLVSM